MKLFDIFVLGVSFVSLFVIIIAEDHVRGVPFPLGMLRLNNAACSKFPASTTKCKRGKATPTGDRLLARLLRGQCKDRNTPKSTEISQFGVPTAQTLTPVSHDRVRGQST